MSETLFRVFMVQDDLSCLSASPDPDDRRPETPGARATLKTRSAQRPLPAQPLHAITHAHYTPLLPTAVRFTAAATLSNCRTCRTASSPRWLSHFSGHAAAASMRCDFPATSLPKPPLLVPPTPSSQATSGRAFRGPQSLNETGKPGSLTPLRQHRFSSARTPLAVFQANLPYPDSNRNNRGTQTA